MRVHVAAGKGRGLVREELLLRAEVKVKVLLSQSCLTL